MHPDPVHLADERVGVGRSALAVPRFLAGALIQRRVALAVAEGAGVVARREIQATIGAELQRRAVVAALQALLLVFEDQLLAARDELVVFDRESGQVLAVEADRGIDDVDPSVLRELRVEGEGEEPVFLGLEDLQFRDEQDALGLRVVHLQRAAVFVEPETPVGGELEVHRLGEAGDQLLRLETHIFGKGVGGTGERAGGQRCGAEEGQEAGKGGVHGGVVLGRGGVFRPLRHVHFPENRVRRQTSRPRNTLNAR